MVGQLDRRTFLAGAVTAVGATACADEVPTPHESSSTSEDREPTHDDLSPVVVGVMGLHRGRALAHEFASHPNVQVKYVCDVDLDRANSCNQSLVESEYRPAQAIQDFRRILGDSEVDALVCAAPNHWHAPATILACKADKHVYVEKPCSHNPREGEMMVDAAHKYGRVVQLGTQRRSCPGITNAIQQVHDGAIGEIYLARAFYGSARGTIGKGQPCAAPEQLDFGLWQGPAPQRMFKDNLVHYNWHWHWHWGNGELGNNGVHTLDLCRWGLGVNYPSSVTSSGGRFCFDDDQETPDTHTVCFDFSGKKSITWQGLSCNPNENGFVKFYGTNGAIDLGSSGSYTVYDLRGNVVRQFDNESNVQFLHVANFLDAIRNGDSSRLNADITEGHQSTLLCHLGNIAHRMNRSLTCDESNGHILRDEEAMQLWWREYNTQWEPTV